jgi:hypothetical protein
VMLNTRWTSATRMGSKVGLSVLIKIDGRGVSKRRSKWTLGGGHEIIGPLVADPWAWIDAEAKGSNTE